MSGDKCAYIGCGNTRRTTYNIIFHPFPSNQEVHKRWIMNSGNIELESLSVQKLKKKFICSSHFERNAYSNPAAPKSRLNRNAVPKSYLEEKSPDKELINVGTCDVYENYYTDHVIVKEEKSPDKELINVGTCNVYENYYTDHVIVKEEKSPDKELINVGTCDIYENHFNSPSASPGTKCYGSYITQLPSPKNKTCYENLTIKYKKLFEKQKRLLSKENAKINFLKKQLNKKRKQEKLNIKSFIQKTKFVSKNSKALVTMQLLHNKRKSWLQSEKKLAISLFYKSPAAYEFMRKNIILPGVSSLYTWLKTLQYKPGFSPEYMTQLKMMCKTMTSKEKKCTVLVDEMAVKRCLEYNKSLDMLEGYEDLGNLGRSSRPAKLALVIMIRGLYHKWKLPMSYFLSSTRVKGDKMAQIMKECILELIKIGFDPVCITCNPSKGKQKMFSTFNATPDNPYTFIEGKKINLIFNVQYLFKSIRNILLNGDILLKTLEGIKKTIRFYDFKKAYEIDKSSLTAQAMCIIGEQHINPNPWQKMSCKVAIQTFSNSVSEAITTYVATGQLRSTTALDTANFFSELNDLFDALNSKHILDKNPIKKPLCENNPNVLNIIKKSINTFKNAEKLSFKNSKIDRPPCFTQLIWTLKSLLDLYESEKSEMILTPSTNFFLMTSHLCQDHIENLFPIFRQKGDCSKNLTCRTLRCSFAKVCSSGLLNCASEKSNCIGDDFNDTFLASSGP